MKLSFWISNKECIMDLVLTNYSEVSEMNVYNVVIARSLLRKTQCVIDGEGLREFFQYYMDGDLTIKGYIDHIEKYGFYTPYHPNLGIVIERTEDDEDESNLTRKRKEGATMKLIFTGSEGQPFFDLILTDYEKVSNMNVYSFGFTREILKKPDCIIDGPGLRERLKFLMGGDGTMKEYIDHIEKYGFYSPYQPNLNILIERTEDDEKK